jgi:hypothetical protein
MNLTDKQKILLDAAKEKGQLTQSEAKELLREGFLINHSQRVAEILINMVRAGILEKVKHGTYRLPEQSPYKDQEQLKLL